MIQKDLISYPSETDNSYKPYLGSNAYDAANDAGTVVNKFGTAASEYTVAGVPEPATCAFLGLSSLLMLIRRKVSIR